MANCRPAGMSDDETDSDDDYGFYDKPVRRIYPVQENPLRIIEESLQNALKEGDVNAVRHIIAYDLNNNVNSKLDTGWTALMHACSIGVKDAVDYLLESGANPNLHCDSITPIMRICTNTTASDDDVLYIVDKLLDKGAILNMGDRFGQTPLVHAIASGRVALVEKLLNNNVNIEMRDQKGWTAVFEAVHHNKPDVIELLVSHGARLTEVDRSGRTLYDIATSLDYDDVITTLDKYLKAEEDEEENNTAYYDSQPTTWHDFYPGIKKGEVINYSSEIPNLLYGMSCEKLTPLIMNTGMSLKEFLLLEEKDMLQLGIELPYERQRLLNGLRSFHRRSWKLGSVAGLYAGKKENYCVLDCLATLGTHLHQIYILEASLQYTMRSFKRVKDQVRSEPSSSPVVGKLKETAKNVLANIRSNRTEIRSLKKLLTKINKNNPVPANIVREKSTRDVVVGYFTKIVFVCSVGMLVYKIKFVK